MKPQNVERDDNFSGAISLPSRLLAQKIGALLLLVLAILFIVISKSNKPLAERVRSSIMDVVTPVMGVLSSPVEAVSNAKTNVGQMFSIYDENRQLQQENTRLKQWYEAAQQLEKQNEALRKLINVVPMQVPHYITARVVGDSSSAFQRSALVNVGEGHGILPDSAVISDLGLVGRISDLGTQSARVQLLTDINARIPVVAENSQLRSILAGNSGAMPELTYLPRDHSVAVGERVLTSGDGGIFPPNIPVGIVEKGEGETLFVRPFANWSKLHHVSVVDFKISQPE